MSVSSTRTCVPCGSDCLLRRLSGLRDSLTGAVLGIDELLEHGLRTRCVCHLLKLSGLWRAANHPNSLRLLRELWRRRDSMQTSGAERYSMVYTVTVYSSEVASVYAPVHRISPSRPTASEQPMTRYPVHAPDLMAPVLLTPITARW